MVDHKDFFIRQGFIKWPIALQYKMKFISLKTIDVETVPDLQTSLAEDAVEVCFGLS